MKDLHNLIEVELLHLDAAVAADTDGTGLDLLGYSAATAIVRVGASGSLAAGAYWALELEESADNVTYTDVAEAQLIGAISGTTTGRFALVDDAAEDDRFYRVGYIGMKRYLRLHIEKVGAPDAVPIYAFLLKHAGAAIPTPNP